VATLALILCVALSAAACSSTDGSASASKPIVSDGAATQNVASADQATKAVASSKYIQQHIPTSQLVVLKQSGHFPFVEQPDEFAAAVRAFMQP
jgi:hypothetical protein